MNYKFRRRDVQPFLTIGGAIKYAGRYRRTRDLDDLKKAVDLLQIYCGVQLAEREQDK